MGAPYERRNSIFLAVEGAAVHLQNPSLMKDASPVSASIKNGRSEPLGLNAEIGENSQIIKMIIENYRDLSDSKSVSAKLFRLAIQQNAMAMIDTIKAGMHHLPAQLWCRTVHEPYAHDLYASA
jgi:hypothetical protein